MEPSAFEAARLTVRLGALAANYRAIQRLAAPAAVAGVVKADGYGTGAAQGGVQGSSSPPGCPAAVLSRAWKRAFAFGPLAPRARIFVLDGAQVDSIAALITNNLTPVLNSLMRGCGVEGNWPDTTVRHLRLQPFTSTPA